MKHVDLAEPMVSSFARKKESDEWAPSDGVSFARKWSQPGLPRTLLAALEGRLSNRPVEIGRNRLQRSDLSA